MKTTHLPHQHLFDELQIAMIPLSKDLFIVHSLVKWANATLNREAHTAHFAWMLSENLNHSPKRQIEKLTSLRQGVRDLNTPLKELMRHILEFSSLKPIEKSLITFHKLYLDIPSIDNEMHLLYLGTDLFQNQEILSKLTLFTEKLLKLNEASLILKKTVIDALLQNLSFTLEKAPRVDLQLD